MSLNESIVEDALEWFGELGYSVGQGFQLAPGEPSAERGSFGEVFLASRLREAIHRLNPVIPSEGQEEAFRKVIQLASPSLIQSNRASHHMLCGSLLPKLLGGELSVKARKSRTELGV